MELFARRCGLLSPGLRGFASAAQASTSSGSTADTVKRVQVSAHTPIRLSENLQELGVLLRDKKVKKYPALLDTNMTSMKELVHFLKKYSEGMRKDEPLKAQRRALEFVIPARKGELRRVVCNVGTTGTNNSHTLVHRAMQGLFKELGLTPNFLWDDKFEVPEVHLPYDQRQAMQEARMDKTVDQIKRAQAGQEVQETEHLKVVSPEAAAETVASRPAEADALADKLRGSDSAAPSAAAPPSTDAASAHDPDDADSLAGIHVDADEMRQLALQCDESVRMVAIAPWTRVVGGERARLENEAVSSYMATLTTVVPTFGSIIDRVWSGEMNEAALVASAAPRDGDRVSREVARCLVKQLLQCAEALDRAAGKPDATRPKARHALVRVVAPVAVLKEWVDANEAIWQEELEKAKKAVGT